MGYWDEPFAYADDHLINFPKFTKTVITQEAHPIYNPETIWDFLHQTKVWRGKSHEDIKIKDMDKSYPYNVLHWLDTHYGDIIFALGLAKELGKISEDEELDFSIFETPLYKKMKQRYLKLAKT